MKKLIIISFIVFSATAIKAQQTESNHSVTLSFISLNYNYEQSLGKRFSIVGSAGGIMEMALTSWSGFIYNVHPVIGAEPRWYYSLRSRLKNGRRTFSNSAEFFSVDTRYIFEPVIVEGTVKESFFMIAPNWGLRRVFASHWLLELNAGWNFFMDSDGEWSDRPRLNFKFGYVF